MGNVLTSLYNWIWRPLTLPHVISTLRFIKPLPLYEHEKPFHCEFKVKHIPGARSTNVELEVHQVPIQDIRHVEDRFTVEQNGFEVLHHESAVNLSNIAFHAETRQQYIREVESIMKERYSASLVSCFGSEVRDNTQDGGHMPGALVPVSIVHIDQTHSAIERRATHHFGPEKASELLRNHRIMIVNLWRPIAEPVLDMPLAVCDTRSVKRTDCIAVDNVKLGDYVGEDVDLQYNVDQRFYYLSRQTCCEPWLIFMGEHDPRNPKQEHQGVPHGAFPLPTVQNPPPRKSVEVRCLVVI